jgi:hypothetical protein
MNRMSREEYIEWHIDHYGSQPKPYLLDKYYPPDPHDTTEKDKQEFWEGVEPEK